jgi:hypothetical protein
VTEAEFLRSYLCSLREEIRYELHRRRHPGGQQCGVPRMASMGHGLLIELERDLRHVLQASDEWIEAQSPEPASGQEEE